MCWSVQFEDLLNDISHWYVSWFGFFMRTLHYGYPSKFHFYKKRDDGKNKNTVELGYNVMKMTKYIVLL
jgi:hypothetical protein